MTTDIWKFKISHMKTMKRIFMVGYSGNKGGVETYIDQLTAALNQYEFVFSLPLMTINGKEWRRPPNRHNYLFYCYFWHKFFKENHFDVLYFNRLFVALDKRLETFYSAVKIVFNGTFPNGRHAKAL